MPASDLAVPAGQTVVLSMARAAERGGEVAHLRPKTVLALKALAGVAPAMPVRFSDSNHFEVVAAAGNLKSLRPDANGRVVGLKATLLKAVIATIPSTGRMPESVRLHQKIRGRAEPSPTPRGTARRRDIGTVVRTQEFGLPTWLKDLELYVDLPRFRRIVVGPNATLELDSSITHLWCTEVLIHTGGRVVSRAPQLTVDVSGTFKGDVA